MSLGQVTDPLIELLAIALYEHDHNTWPPTSNSSTGWGRMDDDDREIYREMARGEKAFGYEPDLEKAKAFHDKEPT